MDTVCAPDVSVKVFPRCFSLLLSLSSAKPWPRAEARPTGRAVSKERLEDWDGQMEV
jgi:hypothetical protein